MVQNQQTWLFLEVTGELHPIFIVECRFFSNFCLFLALFKCCLSLPPATYPLSSQDDFGMLHITSPQSNPKKAHSRRQTNPRKQSLGRGEKTCLKAKNYSRLGGFFPPILRWCSEINLSRWKSPRRKLKASTWMNAALLVVVFKGID